jgi:S1-C subfamily serine protease
MLRRSALLLLALVALAPGCGGGDDETTTSTSTSASAAAEATGEPSVYFGFLKAVDAGGEGALVKKVEARSPISSAGLQEGDVIVAVDGEPVTDAEQAGDAFEEISFTATAGDTVEVEVQRDSKQETVTILLAPNVLLGAEVEDVEVVESTGEVEAGSSALRVAAVGPGTPAEKAGLKPSNLILEIDGQPVATTADLFAALGEHVAGDEVELTVEGDRGTETLDLTVEDRTRPAP